MNVDQITLNNIQYYLDKSLLAAYVTGHGENLGTEITIPSAVQVGNDIYFVYSIGSKAFYNSTISTIYLPQPKFIPGTPFFFLDSFNPSTKVIVKANTLTPFALGIMGIGFEMVGWGNNITRNGLSFTQSDDGLMSYLTGVITSAKTYDLSFTNTASQETLSFQIIATELPTPTPVDPAPTPSPCTPSPCTPCNCPNNHDNSSGHQIYSVAAIIVLLMLAYVIFNNRQKIF